MGSAPELERKAKSWMEWKTDLADTGPRDSTQEESEDLGGLEFVVVFAVRYVRVR